MLRRFVEEAQIGGQLQHPGVVPVYELGTFGDRRPYFTMKLVKGQTLAALLKDRADPAAERPRCPTPKRRCAACASARPRTPRSTHRWNRSMPAPRPIRWRPASKRRALASAPI